MAKQRKGQQQSTRTATRARVRAQCIRALEQKGKITANELVAAARNPKHPMHDDFLWDDKAAGHQHRLDQARGYIAEVRMVVTYSSMKFVSPGYLKDRNVSPLQGYIATQTLRTDRDAAQETMVYEMNRLQALIERCREIAAVLEMEHELAKLEAVQRLFVSRIRTKHAPTHTDDQPALGT